MPATRSRISASSSTMRMSPAMTYPSFTGSCCGAVCGSAWEAGAALSSWSCSTTVRATSAAALRLRHGGDCLARVLDDVGERLGDQAAVKMGAHRVFRRLDLDLDVGMADAHHEHDLPHRVGDVLFRHHRLRHAGEARELV